MQKPLGLAVVVVALTLFPSAARAERLFTPFAGVSFGADSGQTKAAYGAAITFLGRSAGLEFELAALPAFFEADGESHLVTTITGRIVIGRRTLGRGLRPFVSIGAGVIRARVEATSLFDDQRVNDLALDFGGGLTWFVIDNLGIRGDARYVRKMGVESDLGTLPISGSFAFWRATFGASFLF